MNGNLQISQFSDGAAQPSLLAATVAGALFYGNGAAGSGHPQSDPGILTNGDIAWTGPRTAGNGAATDLTGSGTSYHYVFPASAGTNFFQVTLPGALPIGRTFGLVQQSQPGPDPDPQWPLAPGFRFAVNPLSGNEIVISSLAGRVFRTEDQGVTWFSIGEPADLDSTNAQALTFGAPDPNNVGNLDNFIYAGTVKGDIFVTFNGGGNAGMNPNGTDAWLNISAGLDGSAVQEIVTDPTRGSHDAYAVTLRGVYFMPDSTAPNATWINFTGNVFQLTRNSFFDPNLNSPALSFLTSIQADWRFQIPLDPSMPPNPVTNPTHPILYVGGQGGVFRSLDQGKTWTIFPDVAHDGAPIDGGFLPVAQVSRLTLVLGNINPTTGLPDQSGGPDMLVATTFGRGLFAIRLPLNVAPGPRVVSFIPAKSTSSVSFVLVTFNQQVDPSTFTASQISVFHGPNGNIPLSGVTVTNVNPTGNRIFEISFPTQTTPGTYTITFGPNIRDFSGNQMDQNGNGINGQGLADSYSGHFTIASSFAPPEFATGAGIGGGPEVVVFNALTGAKVFDFFAYAVNFTGGVRVAMGDVNGDGIPDIITAPGPGGGPDIRVFDGSTGALIREFMAYAPTFTGGVFVAVADVNGDGFGDIITGAGAGGGPEVKVFSGKDGSVLADFFAYDSAFTGGVQVAGGDTNGDGFADIITAAGPGGGPHVKVYSGANPSVVLQSFFAFDPNFHGGVNLGVADINGDGRADILTGAGFGGPPVVEAWSGTDLTILANFFAFSPQFLGGVRVAGIQDVNGDGHDDIVTGAGFTGGPQVIVYDGQTQAILDSLYAYDPHFLGGVFVGGH
jgi:hypothetical protein